METTQTQAAPQPVFVRDIVEGFNYRRRYDEQQMLELRESIRTAGLATAILVRPVQDGKYQLIAGGRRYKAFSEEFGPDAQIPALIKVLTDSEATVLMNAENTKRADPSAIEDAECAHRMLGLVNGDRDEACARLGWERTKLNRRLALMNAIDKVRDAYLDKKIQLGHVEILAALRKDVQANVIQKILEQAEVPTVEQLRKLAEGSLLMLEQAIFDKAECQTCEYNTGYQQMLFETSFEGTRCTNRECFNGKTETELETRRMGLTEMYQVVRIVRPGDNSTVTPLRAEGDKSVGPEQAKACRSCGDFGACVSAVPDKMGKVFKDVCFNKACNDEKVKLHQATLVAATQQEAPQAPGQSESEKPGATVQSAKNSSGATPPTPSVATLRNPIKDYREAIWRIILSRAVTKLPPLQNRAFLAAMVLNNSNKLSGMLAKDKITKKIGVEMPVVGAGETLQTMLSLSQEQMAEVLQLLGGSLETSLPINEVVAYLKVLAVDIKTYWKLNEDFLKILTTTEMDAIAQEIGLAQASGKNYNQIKKGTKSEFAAALLKVEGFQYIGAVPKVMCWA